MVKSTTLLDWNTPSYKTIVYTTQPDELLYKIPLHKINSNTKRQARRVKWEVRTFQEQLKTKMKWIEEEENELKKNIQNGENAVEIEDIFRSISHSKQKKKREKKQYTKKRKEEKKNNKKSWKLIKLTIYKKKKKKMKGMKN